MPRGVTNKELWDAWKNALQCNDGCLMAIVFILVAIGLILLCL